MKQFNLNHAHLSLIPTNNFSYELCDKYGIYVVAEANIKSHGMGYDEKTLAKNPSYKKAHLERNQRNVQRSFNHPSIIFWSLGNEAGYGPNLEAPYDWVKPKTREAVPPVRGRVRTEKPTARCITTITVTSSTVKMTASRNPLW